MGSVLGTLLWPVGSLFSLAYTTAKGKPQPFDMGTYASPPKDELAQYSKGTHYVTDETTAKPIMLAKKGPASRAPMTVMKVFDAAVAKHGDATALRMEVDGEWVQFSFKRYHADVMRAARAYVKLGLKRGQSVNIIGFNSYEWFVADVGAIYAGGLAAGIYTTNGPAACQYIAEHSAAAVVVVENQKQLEKFLECGDALPKVKAIVQYKGDVSAEARAAVEGKQYALYSWTEFLTLGDSDAPDGAQLDAEITARHKTISPGHACTLIYTSGTTGNPKAVMISHDSVTWTAQATLDTVPGFSESTECIVSYLPLSHIAAQMLDIHAPMVCSVNGAPCEVWFARPDALKGTLGATLKAARPTIFFGVPRVWEKMSEAMKKIGAKNTKGLKKIFVEWCKRVGAAAYDAAQVGGSGQKHDLYNFVDGLMFKKVAAGLGLDRAKQLFTGAAPIGQDTLRYFGSLQLPVMELYGMSECTGPQTVSRSNYYKIGACGPSLPGTELKIDHVEGRDQPGEGEICYRGRNIMLGYMHNKEKSAEAIDDLGFLHSGDVGRVGADGLLYITGRIKELIITAGGENIAPAPIEEIVKTNCPALSGVMMVGDKRKYNVCLVTLKTTPTADGGFTNQLTNEALAVSPGVTTVEEAAACPKWTEYITAGIKASNAVAVSNAQKIQKFKVLPVDFSVAGGELTPTLKLKRSIVSKKYAAEIDKLYA